MIQFALSDLEKTLDKDVNAPFITIKGVSYKIGSALRRVYKIGKRDGYQCQYCGSHGTHCRVVIQYHEDKDRPFIQIACLTPTDEQGWLTIDHIRPQSHYKGKSGKKKDKNNQTMNKESNFRLLCNYCNVGRGNTAQWHDDKAKEKILKRAKFHKLLREYDQVKHKVYMIEKLGFSL